MRKAAFAVWEDRIAPVFDTTRKIRLVEVESGEIVRETEKCLDGEFPVQKAFHLIELEVAVLVCGAITRSLREIIVANGIQVISFITGDLREVIHAWMTTGLRSDDFVMPGCFGRGHRRLSGRQGFYREGNIMNGRRGGGMGQGGGRGRGGQRAGRAGGMFAAGSGGFCVCPQCGKKEPHEQGMPCFQRRCPDCGVNMIRERTVNN
ncbi:MAG: hypothetical protein GX147_06655 [Deltaproteobacteria bacterium]|nr:hypothetical protein [Deltaproteobacteria bacterium]